MRARGLSSPSLARANFAPPTLNPHIMSLQGEDDHLNNAGLFSPSRSKSLLGRGQSSGSVINNPAAATQRVIPTGLFSTRVELVAHIGFCVTGVLSAVLIDWDELHGMSNTATLIEM